jgi:PKD repeat protein
MPFITDESTRIPDGIWYFHLTSSDIAGNTDNIGAHYKIRIDRTPPQVGYSLLPGSGHYNKVIVFTGEDYHSGIDQISYRLNNGPWIAGTSVTINLRDKNRIEFYARDKAGNVSGTGIITPNAIPVARFTATPMQGTTPLSVKFDARSSSDADGDALTYAWTFGDGTTGNGSIITRVYTKPGNYRALLTVMDGHGGSDTTSLVIKVLNTAPVARFTANPVSGFAPLTVDFDASASTDADGDALTYSWNFGDGSTASGKKVSHVYASQGNFKATLTVTDPHNAKGSAFTTITVSAGLKLQYRVRANEIAPNDKHIKPHFVIVNSTNRSVPYRELTIRYWFTNDGNAQPVFWCDYAALGTNKVQGKFKTLAKPVSTANRYVEVSFTTQASLGAFSNSGEIQTRFNKTDWSDYNEKNDYSYDGSKTQYADWDRVTLYRNGNLIWGVEPVSSSECYDDDDDHHHNDYSGHDFTSREKDDVTIEAHPNPFRNDLKITLNAGANNYVTVDLINIDGEHMATIYNGPVEKFRTYEFNFDSWRLSTNGLYLCRVKTRDKTYYIKLLLMR